MITDSRQQKEKQSKAKGCLWVIAGVGFIVSVLTALAILGALLPEPEVQTAPPARVALDAEVVENIHLYHLLVMVALGEEITATGEIGDAIDKMMNGLRALDEDMIEMGMTDHGDAFRNLAESNAAAIQAIKGASDEFDKLPLDRLDKNLVDEVRQYHAFVALSRSETLQYLQDYSESWGEMGEAFSSASLNRAASKTVTAIENWRNSNKVAIQAINNASDAFTSLVE